MSPVLAWNRALTVMPNSCYTCWSFQNLWCAAAEQSKTRPRSRKERGFNRGQDICEEALRWEEAASRQSQIGRKKQAGPRAGSQIQNASKEGQSGCPSSTCP